MDNNMKGLFPDKFHLQAKMQEWLEANQEIYTDFKSKIQSILKNLLCDNYSKQIDDEANKLQSIILEIMTTEEGAATDEMIDKFSNAIEDGNVSACCLYCYLELDNGLKEIEYAISKFEQSEDAKYIKEGIHAYWEDEKRETQEAVNKDLNLLSLRRWHYEHPGDYQEFTNLLPKHTKVT